MGRRQRRGRPVNGLLLLDKPAGESSNRSLQRVKRLFDARKAGHTGSLDPLATGMLPVCFGEATKLSGFLLDADKGYETTLRLGQVTDSADADGRVIAEAPVPDGFDEAALKHICKRFIGPQQQIPPMVSAISIGGRRLYELAREGKTVERPPRAVTLHRIDVLGFDGIEARLSVVCSKGTYIRSLVSDIGEAVGCGAHVIALRRTFVAPFEHRRLVTLPMLESLGDRSRLDALLLPMDAGLQHLPAMTLCDAGRLAFTRGQQAAPVTGLPGTRADVDKGVTPDVQGGGSLCRVYAADGALLGLGHGLVDPATGRLRVQPSRVLQLNDDGSR